MVDFSDVFKIYDRTRRAEVNWGATLSAGRFWEAAKAAMYATSKLKDFNFDARDHTKEQSIDLLDQTIEGAQTTKKLYLRVRRELDDLIFNLDWYIERCRQDLERFKGH